MKTKTHKRRANPVQMATGFTVGLIMVLASVYITTLMPVGPLPEALPYMNNRRQVRVDIKRYAFFQSADSPSKTGFIFYPGGRVDYRSYAPMAQKLAEKGWSVAIVPMPLNLAVLGSDRASQVINDHPEISHWIIGGHSLGGSMAAQYLIQEPQEFEGIVFLASYPSGKGLSDLDIPVLSIFASEDGLITPDERETYRERLPTDARWMIIEGGNHAGFGWYGKQEGDNPSIISLEDQTDQVVQAIDQFIRLVDDIK